MWELKYNLPQCALCQTETNFGFMCLCTATLQTDRITCMHATLFGGIKQKLVDGILYSINVRVVKEALFIILSGKADKDEALLIQF